MKPKDAYRTERDIAIRGKHLMRMTRRVGKAELQAPRACWLLIGDDPRERLTCESLAVAAKIYEIERDTYGRAGDIAELLGVVLSQDGVTVEHWIAPNGGVWALEYLGKESDKTLATEPLKVADL